MCTGNYLTKKCVSDTSRSINFSFTLQYFNKFASPFDDNAATCSRPKKSKVQWNREIKFTDADIVNASYEFLHSNTEYFRHKWNWSRFFQKYSKHKDNNIRWCVIN